MCRRCPVRAQCAGYALSTKEPYGVWGGFTEHERLRLLREGWSGEMDVRRLEARLTAGCESEMSAPRSAQSH